MTDIDTIREAKAAIGKAKAKLSDLCHGRERWHMSIPADPENDPDIVIMDGLHKAEEALAALSTIDTDIETAWLIEATEAQKAFFVKWGYMSDTRPTWWAGVDEDIAGKNNPSWTQDSLEAVRFARKIDAEKIILGWGYSLENAWAKVTEHRWG